ncbi:MAG: hypothetical protein IPN44_07695 [Flavobacteriales bacterium]|nr:hypothetical protein [Flavobacteriales bacterium]
MRIYPRLLIVASLLCTAALHAQVLQENWWKPNGAVRAMAVDTVHNVLYVGGHFDAVSPIVEDAKGVALLRGSNGAILPNADLPNGPVAQVISDGHKGWYLLGSFTKVGSETRNGLARVDSAGDLLPFFRNMTFGIPYFSPSYGYITLYDIALKNNTLYVGGLFDRVGMDLKNGGVVGRSSGLVSPASAEPNNRVLTSIPDGNGGWFIGGEFTAVGGEQRKGLARLNADGSLNSWNPGTNGSVISMVLRGNSLYVMGNFSELGGAVRQRLGSVNITTALVTEWNPGMDGSSGVMCASGTTLYLAGSFQTIGGQARGGFASFDLATGTLTPWSPIPLTSGEVKDMIAYQGSVYLGGSFRFSDNIHSKLVAIDGSSGVLEPWDPNPNFNVADLDISGSTLFIGGSFTNAGGLAQPYLTSFDLNTGSVIPWPAANYANGAVEQLLVKGSVVYAAGEFTQVGGVERLGLAAVNASDGSATTWALLKPIGTVKTLSADGTSLYMGGGFKYLGGVQRLNTAALDAVTGEVQDWNVSVDDYVTEVEVSGDVVYLGGSFKWVNGLFRRKLCAIDAASGALLPFNAHLISSNFSPSIRALLVRNGRVYVAGGFSEADGVPVGGFAAFQEDGTLLPEFTLGQNASVYTLCSVGSTLYIGGDFISVRSGISRGRGAAIDLTTGALKDWDPRANNSIKALASKGGRIFAAGTFTNCGGAERLRLAALDKVAGDALNWTADLNGDAASLAFSGPRLYVTGAFTSLGAVMRKNLAAFDMSTGAPTDWRPDPDGDVYSLLANGNKVVVGGTFATIAGQPRSNLAAIDRSTGQANPWSPVVNNNVASMVTKGGTLYVGGAFTDINGLQRLRTAAFSTATGALLPWHVPLDSAEAIKSRLNALAVNDNTIYMAGYFKKAAGELRSSIAAADASTGILSSWTPELTRSDNHSFGLDALLVDDDALFISGAFTKVGTADRNYVAALDLVTGQATDWNADPTPYATARSFAKWNSNLFAGGFEYVGDDSNYYGKPVSAWNSSTGERTFDQFEGVFSSSGNCLAVAGDLLFVGQGSFSQSDFGDLQVYSLQESGQRSTAMATVPERGAEVLLLPNPTAGANVRLVWAGADPEARNALVSVFSTDGRMLMEYPVPVSEGRVEAGLDLPKGTAPGLYLVRVVAGERSGTARLALEREE